VTFHRYVALGDSFTEGVGDPDPGRPNGVRGWADRAADVLAARTDDFGYANLAIRGRKLQPVLAEQLEPALALEPDLVTIYAGANDIMRPSVDIDRLVTGYDAALGQVVSAGAHLVMFTAFDPGGFPVFGTMRGRFAVYNELVREVAEHHGATLVDFWRMRDYRAPGMWADDRMHMSSAGHQRMAMAVLDALGIDHDLAPLDLPPAPRLTKKERRAANVDWARTHAAPWVKRRLTGKSSGDLLDPRYPTLERP
jgi:lysophospholipase L1-like esterase